MDEENTDIYEKFDNEESEGEFDIKIPFDPKLVDITVEPSTISKLVDRLKHNEIDLFPDFQRGGNLWDKKRMSQLIESILIKLPLPAFYLDVSNDDKWVIVDGLQRLSTLQRFIIDDSLKLGNLEFLKELEGKTYTDLGRVFQRVIDETQVTLFKIRKGTPKKVLFNLFHRLNTGGLRMTSQEIRHALNQGAASQYLNEEAKQDWFINLLGVSPKRMLDKELFLRFIAFYRLGYGNYSPPLRNFLDEEMEYLNEKSTAEERERFSLAFRKSLERADQIFFELKFSKSIINPEKSKTIRMNRSLFEAVSANLAKLSEEEFQKIIDQKALFITDYTQLLKEPEFDTSITANTGTEDNVKFRHKSIQRLFKKYTGHAYQTKD